MFHFILLSDLIELEEYIKNTLILCGFDPYSALNYLIHDYLSELVSLELILMRVHVFSKTSRIRFIALKVGEVFVFLLHQEIR